MAETGIQPGPRIFVGIYIKLAAARKDSIVGKMSNQDIRLIRVLIVSDSHIMRSGLRRILESQVSIRVLGDVSVEMASAADTILHQHPELVLIDLDPRGNDALGFMGTIQKTSKISAVLVLSDLADHELARKALALGAAESAPRFSPRPCSSQLSKISVHLILSNQYQRVWLQKENNLRVKNSFMHTLPTLRLRERFKA